MWFLLALACGSESDADGLIDGPFSVDVAYATTPLSVGVVAADLYVSDEQGLPVEDCAVVAYAVMPEHGHGGLDEPVVTEVGEGWYRLGWSCAMAGHWELRFELSCPEGDGTAVEDVHVE